MSQSLVHLQLRLLPVHGAPDDPELSPQHPPQVLVHRSSSDHVMDLDCLGLADAMHTILCLQEDGGCPMEFREHDQTRRSQGDPHVRGRDREECDLAFIHTRLLEASNSSGPGCRVRLTIDPEKRDLQPLQFPVDSVHHRGMMCED